jgi:integrase
LKVVADRLGHGSVKITLDTYTHHVPELDRRAAERVAGLLGS